MSLLKSFAKAVVVLALYVAFVAANVWLAHNYPTISATFWILVVFVVFWTVIHRSQKLKK